MRVRRRQSRIASGGPQRQRLAWLLALVLLASPAAAIEEFEFRTPGAGDALREALRAASLLLQARRGEVIEPQELVAAARADYGRLLGVLYAAGHYGGVIRIALDGREAAAIPPLAAPPRVRAVSITVEPGPRFAFGRTEVAPLAPGTALPEDFRRGEPARSGTVQAAVVAAVDGWRAAGHAKAAPAGQEIVADHRRQVLDVAIRLAPGPRLRFGAAEISGNGAVRRERILAIAGLPEGAVFDPALLARAAERLRRTGAFRSVAVTEAERIGPGDSLPIGIALVEETPRRFGLGAELASFDGVRLSGFWLHRNLLGGAERLRIEGDISGIGAQEGGIGYRLAARLTRPATVTPDTELALGAVAESLDFRDYDLRRAGVEAGLVHRFSDRLTGEAAIAFRLEEVRDALGRRNFATLALPLAVTWDRRDVPLNAASGTFLEARATPFLGLSGADSGAQLKLDVRAYTRFGGDGRLVLAGRAQAGAVLGAGLFGTPRDLLFYSGGGGTVRGQPFQSLGVEAGCEGRGGGGPGCTIRLGGQSFAALSLEARVKVTGAIGVVAFADAGFVAADVFGSGDWHAGAGLGLRYDTGIGPIRLDVALPVAGDTGEGLQLYIGIGQAF